MRALLATTNAHKARELRSMLGFRDRRSRASTSNETGATFAANALLKARAAAVIAPPDTIALGEDSGIAVVALGGEPGVRSARFAGPDDAARRRALLARMDGVEDRRAAYVCALAAVLPDGRELVVEGRLEGRARRRRAGRLRGSATTRSSSPRASSRPSPSSGRRARTRSRIARAPRGPSRRSSGRTHERCSPPRRS